MVRAIREIVTVGAGGRVQLDVPSLKPGDRAEVTIRPVSSDPAAADSVKSLDALQRAVALTPEAAEAWAQSVATERKQSSRL